MKSLQDTPTKGYGFYIPTEVVNSATQAVYDTFPSIIPHFPLVRSHLGVTSPQKAIASL
ncbi:hypothetical protein H6F63_06640 [Trichocoleus sp. FACHB-40]|nr:hypothetical protein [Trichocoleus sp. FACHB-40]